MRFEDFSLEVSIDGDGRHRVRVRSSAAGEVSAPIEPDCLSLLQPEVGAPSEEGTDESRPMTEEELRRRGFRLFSLLFPAPIRELFDFSRGSLESRPEQGLRIKLRFDPYDQRLRWLRSLPWECLCYPATEGFGRFLFSDRRFSMVRYLEVPEAIHAPPLDAPLRVLAVAPRPRRASDLALAPEVAAFVDSWKRARGVEPAVLEVPTRTELRRALTTVRPHVLHYMGHGAHDPRTGWGRIYLEDESGGVDPVSENELADLVRGIGTLRLIVLNGCETGRQASTDPARGFTGLAPSLVAQGLPAAVAMQLPISNRAAIAFSSALCERLAAGATIDEAVAEGRLAIPGVIAGSTEWATPVLFMRLPDGRLFGEAAAGPAEARNPVPAEDVLRIRIDEVETRDASFINVDEEVGATEQGRTSEGSRSARSEVEIGRLVSEGAFSAIGRRRISKP